MNYTIVTSISGPSQILHHIAEVSRQMDFSFILVGDSKSPDDFFMKSVDFYSLERQLKTGFELAGICPTGHYCRKNLGYLQAIREGATRIWETDDDNIPYPEFFVPAEREVEGKLIETKGWCNVYALFSDTGVWPRGFPLENLKDPMPSLDTLSFHKRKCLIHQGLADKNPDVDAIYRLVADLPLDFKKLPEHLLLDNGVWCPFNSQNTTWFHEAFPLLYLPATCNFRMTDIWRGFIAQRLLWEFEAIIGFHSATVYQERNEHNLIKDFKDEIPGYLQNNKIKEVLETLELKSGLGAVCENLLIVYEGLVRERVFDRAEMDLVQAWCNDITSIWTYHE